MAPSADNVAIPRAIAGPPLGNALGGFVILDTGRLEARRASMTERAMMCVPLWIVDVGLSTLASFLG